MYDKLNELPYYEFEHNIKLLKKTLKDKEKAHKEANNQKQPKQKKPSFRPPKGGMKGAKF